MAANGIEAIGLLMQQDTTINGLVGSYGGTSFPLIVHGVIPENQQALPAISYTRSSYQNPFGAASDHMFTINCYAENQTESTSLADAVYNLFRNGKGDANGYPVYTSSAILGSIPEQNGSVVNTPVQVRLISIRA